MNHYLLFCHNTSLCIIYISSFYSDSTPRFRHSITLQIYTFFRNHKQRRVFFNNISHACHPFRQGGPFVAFYRGSLYNRGILYCQMADGGVRHTDKVLGGYLQLQPPHSSTDIDMVIGLDCDMDVGGKGFLHADRATASSHIARQRQELLHRDEVSLLIT